MNQTYILLTLLIMCWTLNPFLKKQASKKLSTDEYMIFNHSLCTILVLVYLGYLMYKNKCDINCIKKLDKKEFIYSFAGAITTVLGSILLIKLIKEHEASYIIPHIQPLVIIFTIAIGYFVFHEDINIYKIMGGLLVVAGLFIMNKGKK
jgi:uncharacterized membrane protein